jgi:N-acyl-D-amino-acid deacylase
MSMKIRMLCLLAAGLAVGGCVQASRQPAQAAPASTLIVNARIVDGTGRAPYAGSVRIKGERIVAVGDVEPL